MPHDETGRWSSTDAGPESDAPRGRRCRSTGSTATPVAWRVVDRCVLLESGETATLREWTAALDAAIADASFEPGMSVVHDTRSRRSVPETAEVREGVRVVAARATASQIPRWALVARSGAHYGMARMAQILSELERAPQPEFRVFRDLGEAVAWASAASGAERGSGE
jgi:hypothetical protein